MNLHGKRANTSSHPSQYTQKTCIWKQYLNPNQQVFSLPMLKAILKRRNRPKNQDLYISSGSVYIQNPKQQTDDALPKGIPSHVSPALGIFNYFPGFQMQSSTVFQTCKGRLMLLNKSSCIAVS